MISTRPTYTVKWRYLVACSESKHNSAMDDDTKKDNFKAKLAEYKYVIFVEMELFTSIVQVGVFVNCTVMV